MVFRLTTMEIFGINDVSILNESLDSGTISME